jgi:hypothetical protein
MNFTNTKIQIKSSLQHMIYKTIVQYKNELEINFNNLQIITIVRNPYERSISDLFWFKLININSSKEEVYNILYNHIKTPTINKDNHTLPQYYFILNEKNRFIPKIKILHTELLTEGMHNLGYTDFYNKDNCNLNKVNYYDYLNKESIKLINNYYHKDFKYFGYKKIIP